MTTRQIGIDAENIARKHVKQHGYKIIKRNYYSPYGEIDIIAQKPDCIVFIEVRYRKNQRFGGAAASVSTYKQQRIIKTAACFLSEFPEFENREARFDVIGIEGLETQHIEWLQAAFTL